MKAKQDTLPLRITIVQPPPGVTFRLQRGRDDLEPPVSETAEEISFDLTLWISESRAGGMPNLLGPFAQGPPAARFIYVNSGKRAGQTDTCWDRRAKVPLTEINWLLIEKTLAKPGQVLETRLEGTARDGGPVCASGSLLDKGWRVVPKEG